MNPEDYIEKFARGFATVAMTDTNGLLRGQMVSTASLAGIMRDGMGMAPVTLALDPTDEVLDMPGVTDGSADFHDDPLRVDSGSARTLPWSREGRDLLVLANYAGESAALDPRSLLTSVLARALEHGYAPRYGLELEYTLFDETAESARAKNYRDLRRHRQGGELAAPPGGEPRWRRAGGHREVSRRGRRGDGAARGPVVPGRPVAP